MAASYPSSVKTFSTKAGGGTIEAEHVNAMQDEIASVESGLLSGLAHVLKPLTDAAYDLGTTLLKWKDAFLSGNLSVGGTSTLAGVVSSSGQPRCSAFHNTTQSIANITWATVQLNSEDMDVGGMHDTVTNNERVTVPAGGGGLYLMTGKVTFGVGSVGVRAAMVRLNDTTALMQLGTAPAGVGDSVTVTFSHVGVLAAGDFITLQAYQASGGALNIGNASTRENQNQLQLVKLW
jgi:hypothetical protein